MNNCPAHSLPSAVSPRSQMWLGASLLLVLLRAFPSIYYPLGRDQATFCYIGQRLWEGKQLYLNLWDTKPPGIFYLYALIVKVFGTAMWSAGVVDLLWLLVISCFIFKFAERFLGTAPAVIAVVLHATWRAWSGYWDAAQPENFLVLFVIAAYFLSSYSGKRRWLYDFLSGILFGAAFWLKYNAVAFLPLPLILPYLDFSPLEAGRRLPRFTLSVGDWMRRVGVWATGFTGSVAGVLGYLRWSGAWPAMKEIELEVLPRYNAMAIERSVSYWLYVYHQIGRELGWWSVLVVVTAILVARRTHDLRSTLPVFLAAAMGAVCTAMQARLQSYAFETCYPFFAMLWGYLGVKVFQSFRYFARWCWGRNFRLAAVLVWLVFANLLYLPLPGEIVQLNLYLYDLGAWWTDRDTFYSNYPWARPISHYDGQMHVIRYLREKSTPQDGVFIWGSEPLIYFLAQRNPPTRFVTNLGVISLWTPPAWRLELMRDLEAAPPKYIVVGREDWAPMLSFNFLDSAAYLQQRFPALLLFVTSHYQKVDDDRDFVIYRHD
ncbi:MAG: glycosyltransferase family 39 protein [Terriglobia bacterium]